MDSLRWILLVFGLLLVGGIYLAAFLKKRGSVALRSELAGRDWEEALESRYADQMSAAADHETYDDLPSLDALQQARSQHMAEGNALPPLNEDVVAEIQAADDEREARKREQQALDQATSPEEVALEPEAPQVRAGLESFKQNLSRAEPVLGTVTGVVPELEAEQANPVLTPTEVEEDSVHISPPKEVGIDAPATGAPELVADATVEQNSFSFAEPEAEQPKAERKPAEAAPSQAASNKASTVEQARQQVKQAASVLRNHVAATPNAEIKTTQRTGTDKPARPAEAPESKAPAKPQSRSQSKSAPKSAKTLEQEVVVLHIKANDSIGIYGPELIAALEEMGMKFGEMDIYHYQSGGKRILSVANMVKPGTLNPEEMAGFTTPGISLFLQLNKNSDFDLCQQVLVKSAQYLAHRLNGEVLDSQRQSFSPERKKALMQRIDGIKTRFSGQSQADWLGQD